MGRYGITNGKRYEKLYGQVLEQAEWKTPTVPNGGRQPKTITETGQTPDGVKRQVDLAHQVRMREGSDWPTPTSRDWRDSGREAAAQNRKSPCLPAVTVLNEATNWPTPHSNCHTGAGAQGREGGLNLQTAAGQPDPANLSTNGKRPGSLNPAWVEQLMGYPEGWTELDD